MSIKTNFCQVEDCGKLRDKKQGSSFCTMHRVRRSRYKSTCLPEKEKLPKGIIKICIHHGEITINDAYQVPGKTYFNCKICKKIRSKKFKERNPNYKQTKNYIFIGKSPSIRIEVKQYEKMLNEQNGLCKICNNPEVQKHKSGITKRLAIDHCHSSSSKGIIKIRGLLCQYCNQSLGGFKDSIEILQSAIEYLKNNN